MNIFALDLNTEKCAQYHVDKHVVKMISEYSQLLCTTANLHGLVTPMKPTHQNHPSRLWLDESKQNVIWLEKLLYALHEEWQYRYNHDKTRLHKSFEKYIEFSTSLDNVWYDCLPDVPMTPFKLAMSDDCRKSDPIESYREYYRIHKINLHNWKKRDIPDWL